MIGRVYAGHDGRHFFGTLAPSYATASPPHLSEMHHRGRYLARPRVLALGARVPGLPVPVHDRLQYGSERRDADAGGYHDRVLGAEYVAGRRAVRADQIDLRTTSGGGGSSV